MLHITFSKYGRIFVHKAYYLFTCTCVSINLFHIHSQSHISYPEVRGTADTYGGADHPSISSPCTPSRISSFRYCRRTGEDGRMNR